MLKAPFSSSAVEITRTAQRFGGFDWSEQHHPHEPHWYTAMESNEMVRWFDQYVKDASRI
jgi:dipeptidyl aminopeptidase/acylaminoacyl peptidase